MAIRIPPKEDNIVSFYDYNYPKNYFFHAFKPLNLFDENPSTQINLIIFMVYSIVKNSNT